MTPCPDDAREDCLPRIRFQWEFLEILDALSGINYKFFLLCRSVFASLFSKSSSCFSDRYSSLSFPHMPRVRFRLPDAIKSRPCRL